MSRIPAVVALVALVAGAPARAAILTVTNTNATGTGSLAAAIDAANATTAADQIRFAIPGAGPHVITTGTGYTITNPVLVDGYTQAGSVASTASIGSNAVLRIELRATAATAPLLRVLSGDTTLRGIAFAQSVPEAIQVDADGFDFALQGCFVGLHADGTSGDVDGNGVRALGGAIAIGTTALADRNVVGATARNGILIRDDAVATIVNNLIGVAPNGTSARGNAGAGVDFEFDAAGSTVGGPGLAANVIANNGDGVRLFDTAGSGHRITRNQIFDNTGEGIDLLADGITPNDPGDADEGPNRLHNAPEIFFARQSGNTLDAQVLLDTTYAEGFRTLEFFASPAGAAANFRQGKTFLGNFSLGSTTGETRFFAEVTITVPAGVTPPYTLTATATGPDGSTSEFSNPATVLDGGTVYTVTTADDSGPGSLRAAIEAANADGGASTITFSVPGFGTQAAVLVPLSELPFLSGPAIIDGYTQPGAHVNTRAVGTDAQLRIVVDGTLANSPGLSLRGADVIVRGLDIRNFTAVGVFFANSSSTLRGVVEGCFIGTDETGMLSRPNGTAINPGIASADHRFGGPMPHQRNLVSGGNGNGINPSKGTIIENNLIGIAADGLTPLPNTGTGINVGSDDDDVIIRGNAIAFNGGRGISVADGASAVDIDGNAIHDNALLGIDLAVDGVTANDADDGDAGANGLQNFPTFTARLATNGTDIAIGGSLDRPAGTTPIGYRLDFFASARCDASGHGEGDRFIESKLVTIGAAETFSVTLTRAPLPPVGAFVTATATDPGGNTSEFSACVEVTPADVLFRHGYE